MTTYFYLTMYVMSFKRYSSFGSSMLGTLLSEGKGCTLAGCFDGERRNEMNKGKEGSE
jgi:hypothetical protein